MAVFEAFRPCVFLDRVRYVKLAWNGAKVEVVKGGWLFLKLSGLGDGCNGLGGQSWGRHELRWNGLKMEWLFLKLSGLGDGCNGLGNQSGGRNELRWNWLKVEGCF